MQLFRVGFEGEVWVMADDQAHAAREARQAVRANPEEVELHVYNMVPVSTNLIDDDVADSIPYNASAGDVRTVADHIREINAARAAKAPRTVTVGER